MRKLIAALAIPAAAAAVIAASVGSASAATIDSNFTQVGHGEVAYQIASTVQFNQQRAVFTIKPDASPASALAYGVGLQETVDGGNSVALAVVPSGTNYILEAMTSAQDVTNEQPGTPLPAGSVTFTPIASVNAAAGAPLFSIAKGGEVYLEARQSTRSGLVNYVFGQGANAEKTAATLGTIVTDVRSDFHAPFLGAFGSSTAIPAKGLLASISRNGVTTPAGVNPHGIVAGTRISFDFFNNEQTQVTSDGTLTGTLVLAASPALPGTGSAFGITSLGVPAS